MLIRIKWSVNLQIPLRLRYGSNLRLLFTETDSLMYEIKTEVVYDGSSNDKEIFDNSNFLPESKYYDNSNNLAVGKIKDETAGVAKS